MYARWVAATQAGTKLRISLIGAAFGFSNAILIFALSMALYVPVSLLAVYFWPETVGFRSGELRHYFQLGRLGLGSTK